MLGLLDRIRLTLRGDFRPAAKADGAVETVPPAISNSQIVNFVWLRNKPQPKNDLSDPLPDKYSNNLLEMARKNPDSSVVLWVDESHWNQTARLKLNDLCNREELPNLTLRSLDEIPEYETNKIFTKTRKGFYDHTDPIWLKVDFARILVLSHLLETTDAKQVFYADLDLSAPPISSPEVQNVMQQHGMVFARDNRASRGILENQFMGFGRENADFVSDRLVRLTRNAVSQGVDGWLPMCQAAHEKLGNGSDWLDNITVKTVEIH